VEAVKIDEFATPTDQAQGQKCLAKNEAAVDKLQQKYEMVKELGKGGQGRVELIKDRKSGKSYAAKIFTDKEIADKERINMVKLHHPNIIQLLE
jgi:serine/threonine protein kinase